MSRFSDDYDEDFPNQAALSWANIQRSTRGKKGRPFLEELIAALEAMPVRELHEGYLADPVSGTSCAVGEVVIHRLMARGMTREQAMVEVAKDAECACYHLPTDHADGRGACSATVMWRPDEKCPCEGYRPEHVSSDASIEAAIHILPDLNRSAVIEAMWENDEGCWGKDATPAKRWQWMHDWATQVLAAR